MKVAVLANWGIGALMLETLSQMENVCVSFVVSDFDRNSDEAWRNSVLKCAEKIGIPCLQAGKISGKDLERRLAQMDLMLCHAWKNILPESVYGAPKLGSLNLHPSLLPKLRGPSPHKWVIADGEKEHGLTCHVMDRGIDTGPIVAQRRIALMGNETPENLVDMLKPLVAPVLTLSIRKIGSPNFRPVPQDESCATYAHKTRGKT